MYVFWTIGRRFPRMGCWKLSCSDRWVRTSSSFGFLCEILLQGVDFWGLLNSCLFHRIHGLLNILLRLTICTSLWFQMHNSLFPDFLQRFWKFQTVASYLSSKRRVDGLNTVVCKERAIVYNTQRGGRKRMNISNTVLYTYSKQC